MIDMTYSFTGMTCTRERGVEGVRPSSSRQRPTASKKEENGKGSC